MTCLEDFPVKVFSVKNIRAFRKLSVFVHGEKIRKYFLTQIESVSHKVKKEENKTTVAPAEHTDGK